MTLLRSLSSLDGLEFTLLYPYANHFNDPRSSALRDIHGNDKSELPGNAVSHHLGDELASKKITHVFCVGTAGDLCISHTAMDVASAGFKTYVIEDVTKSFDARKGWPAMKKTLKAKGVEVVMMDGPEVGKVRALSIGGTQGQGTPTGAQGSPATMVFMATSMGLSSLGIRPSKLKG